MSRSRPVVTVYTRRGCGLCARAEELARREARRARLELVDVDADDDLQRRYNVRVPVVAVDGVEVAELVVEPGTIRAAVRAARRARRSP
ncbi:glutaredoxin family protein [Salsipaludibacter albus]|uniref:glutaredoxin family protein n=1 Tax=Salsipaludibacter albus TaxID=2849650 RepID=UPI001EE3E67B|nr:glutaredoxin family protein [Salsipaludibacter albus]MBY5161098.1 glutaredoxin family protein [Salsipaludibacter albus]